MITTKTPFRMSFFGGGTDFPEFYQEHGGAVLSTSFNKYCYVNVRHLPRFFEYTSELVYSKIERVTDISQIEHPAIREAMKYLEMYELRLTYEGDLPARSGLGTSSSFSVGMLNAFYALKGKRVSKKTLADDAIYLERTLCGEAGGIQDQIAASYGGFNRIDFGADGYKVSPVILQLERKKELNNRLMLFFTGFSRFSSDIQKETRLSIKKKESRLLEMLKLVDVAEEVLTTKTDLTEFGRLLDYTWKLKRNISEKVSTDVIDLCYEKAKSAGAVGGKLLGAGGGGFLLFYVEPEYQDNVRQMLKDFLYIPFTFEEDGTRVIYYAPESFDLEGAR
ncbi:GHMP kinase [Lachnospiraceae bacterium]|uniref:GHMP family kinase ATP-binding protein n=1 Tax=Extibacter sp. GGCC_0201 TaxID=2731209 RepID=UPI001AA0F25B|nr:kinase [Extibacter sp. GGCC_0201]MBO1721993.1 kinase [Extibacter sp. GGCC_0201]BDF35177.1 GHMP kinase [Lachnospiraceae bacterium]BDF39178.1 GHMP kinase [Lachnospiraceae bacterium]